jgi:hypothetical protein
MPIETHIINYLHQQSKGVINLSLTQAKKIADMVLGTRMEPSAHVKIYKYDGQTGNYFFYRMVQTDDVEIKKIIASNNFKRKKNKLLYFIE